MAEQFDIVVAGAGHNSLLTAAYLAKAGFRCVVLKAVPLQAVGLRVRELTFADLFTMFVLPLITASWESRSSK